MSLALDRAVRVDRLLPVLVSGVVFGVAVWAATVYAVGVFHDDGVYVILAKSLANGDGYRYLHIPGAPSSTHYPPGYPLLLAVLWKFAPAFPQNIGVFLIANALMLALVAWGTLAFARRALQWSLAAAASAALVATLSYPLLMLSGYLLSEPMFAALLLPALMAAEGLARAEAPPARAALVGAAAGALMLVRTHALALVLAVVVVLVWRKRWRTAALVAVAAVAVVAPWQLSIATHDTALVEGTRGAYGSYAAWMSEGLRSGGLELFLGAVTANVREIGSLLADRFSISDRSAIRVATSVVAGVLLLTGGARALHRAPVTAAFTAIYLCILLVIPYGPWRYIFAIWPLVVLFLGEAARWASELRPRHRAPAMVVFAALFVLAIGMGRTEARSYSQRAWRGPARAATEQIAPLVRWVATRTRPDDVVAVDGEQLVYLFTGRRAVPIVPFTAAEYLHPRSVATNAASMRQLLLDVPVSFVLTIQPAFHASATMLVAANDSSRARSARLVPVDALPGGGVFRVERRDSPPTQQ
ncbi:MAG: hypothetical protein WD825_02175 [Gemmatimonadaceae bacterium]